MYTERMLKIARRGASGYAPENTMEAFAKATQIDCDVVEFDLHMTRDGHIVAMHDHTVQRTTDGIGRIDEITLKQLKQFHEPNGEVIPSLQSIFDLLKNKRKMMLDIKDRAAEPRILELIDENDLATQVIFDADVPEIVINIKKREPRLHVYLGGVNQQNYHDVINQAKTIKAEMIKVHNTIASPAMVEAAHHQHVGVYVWGAEKDADIRGMIALGVDAIVCDFPDRIGLIERQLSLS
jgi:glycerophosphoryl diester phosphodiesterase